MRCGSQDGAVYVALSRARSRGGLRVRDFKICAKDGSRIVRCSTLAKRFYAKNGDIPRWDEETNKFQMQMKQIAAGTNEFEDGGYFKPSFHVKKMVPEMETLGFSVGEGLYKQAPGS